MKPINEFNIKKKIESIRQKALSKVFVHLQSVLYPIFLLAANLVVQVKSHLSKKAKAERKGHDHLFIIHIKYVSAQFSNRCMYVLM